jgi:hypothetical protein
MIHTVSVKTAQLLKDAGFPQETYFWWISTSHRITKQAKRINYYTRLGRIDEHHRSASLEDDLAAPIAEELLQHIRPFHKEDTTYISTFITDHSLRDDEYVPIYVSWFTAPDDKNGLPAFRNESLAELAAECWLYVKRRG